MHRQFILYYLISRCMLRFTESTLMCGCECKLANIISDRFYMVTKLKLPGAFPLDCTHAAKWACTYIYIYVYTKQYVSSFHSTDTMSTESKLFCEAALWNSHLCYLMNIVCCMMMQYSYHGLGKTWANSHDIDNIAIPIWLLKSFLFLILITIPVYI